MFIAEMFRWKAGCGESRTSGLGEGMRKRARAIGCARRIPIPHLEQAGAFFGNDKPITGIKPLHVGKFFKSDALLKLANGSERAERTVAKTVRVFRMMMIWAKETGRIETLPLPKSTPMGHSKIKAENDEQKQ